MSESLQKIFWASFITAPDVIDADRRGESPFDYDKNAVEEIRQIKKILDESDK